MPAGADAVPFCQELNDYLTEAVGAGKKSGIGLYDYSAKPARANKAALVIDDRSPLAA